MKGKRTPLQFFPRFLVAAEQHSLSPNKADQSKFLVGIYRYKETHRERGVPKGI